jgi:hypothetical protein
MSGASNPVADVQLFQEAIELKFRYAIEAAELGYASAAEAVANGALQIPSHHQDLIHFFPLVVIVYAWGPVAGPGLGPGLGPVEEVDLLKTVMTDPSKVDALPCTHWAGVDVRTLVSHVPFCHFNSCSTPSWLTTTLNISSSIIRNEA